LATPHPSRQHQIERLARNLLVADEDQAAHARTCPPHRFRYSMSVAGTSREKAPRFACRFYRTDAGSEPVRDWLKSLPTEVRKDIESDIQQVQWRWPLGKPLVDAFGGGLFEVRTSFGGDIYRVLFCLDRSTMVLLHGFKKKNQRTPMSDLDLARKRQRTLEEAG